MTKNTQGTKISGKNATKDAYIKFYEFLMFDQNYRTLSPNAKILYSFLRGKINYFTNITKAVEEAAANGENISGTKSYRDNEGYIYCIADNTELCYLLNTAESTLGRVKKELHIAGLLLEVPVKDKANRIYPLEPSLDDLQEKWEYLQDIKELRDKKKEAAAQRAKKHAEKKKQIAEKKKATKLADETTNNSNIQNESYGNTKNESYGNIQNESKLELNLSKLELNSSKLELNNLSIINRLKDINLNDTTKIVIQQNIDRLTEDKLNIILELSDVYKDALSEVDFTAVIARVLKSKIKTSFRGLLEKSLQTEIKNSTSNNKETSLRKELLPEWVNNQNLSNEIAAATEEIDIDQLKEFLLQEAAAYKKDINVDELTLDNYNLLGTYTGMGFDLQEALNILKKFQQINE
ncbi:hypothetical protein CON95_27150 [Bacillus toyonensis]|uniref:hypothetical protein n=1 Tax=Bacillus toyonensis TaxID=155322 RepID=UPI000BED18B2|nr:hypothetical protein [Bacillus toyonensis]PEE20774.1 hypothetical protein CON95_27150 [Bacillus toyonensis]